MNGQEFFQVSYKTGTYDENSYPFRLEPSGHFICKNMLNRNQSWRNIIYLVLVHFHPYDDTCYILCIFQNLSISNNKYIYFRNNKNDDIAPASLKYLYNCLFINKSCNSLMAVYFYDPQTNVKLITRKKNSFNLTPPTSNLKNCMYPWYNF